MDARCAAPTFAASGLAVWQLAALRPVVQPRVAPQYAARRAAQYGEPPAGRPGLRAGPVLLAVHRAPRRD
jgi:hypothetical protein